MTLDFIGKIWGGALARVEKRNLLHFDEMEM